MGRNNKYNFHNLTPEMLPRVLCDLCIDSFVADKIHIHAESDVMRACLLYLLSCCHDIILYENTSYSFFV